MNQRYYAPIFERTDNFVPLCVTVYESRFRSGLYIMDRASSRTHSDNCMMPDALYRIIVKPKT